MAVDYRDWGFDSRDPRERRSADEARPQSWDYTGESGAHRADLGGAGGYPSGGSSSYSSGSYSSGSIYRGRRRQQDDVVADDRPYGRRSARTRWQQGEEDSTGTFSRYEEPDDRSRRHEGGWSPEVAPTSGWTPSSAPTSGWVGAAGAGEWAREAYTGEWTRGDFTGEWHRDTGEPMMPSRSDGGGRSVSGGRRQAAPDWRELPDEVTGYDERPAVPPQRDSVTDTSEWVPPVGEQTGGGQASRPRRPDWAVGVDPSSSGRRRRSWQDQTEARWPSTRSDGGRTEEPSGSWSASAPVSGLSGASGRSGRADVPAARLSDDDPRWVGIPSSAPRSPAVAFPDEADYDYDYDDRPGARRLGDDPPTTYRASATPRTRDDAPAPGWRAPTAAPDDVADAPTRDWRAPTAAPQIERGVAEAPTRDWRTPTAAPGSERGVADAPTRDWRAPSAAPEIERGVAEAPTRDWRTPTAAPGSERGVAEAPTRDWRTPTERAVAQPSSRAVAAAPAGWRAPAADAGRERALGAAVRRVATPDELDDGFTRAPGGVMAAIVATLAWYAVPVLLFAVYTLVQGEESQVLGSLSGGLTRFAAALAVSLVVAVLLRWVSSTWRSISVGLAAAVVGGGLSTVLLSAISGQPLGG